MDWIQVLVILGVFAAFFVYFMNRMDRKFEALEQKIEAKLEALEQKIEAKLETLERKFEVKFSVFESKFSTEISRIEAKFDAKIDSLQRENAKIFAKISNIEGQITQMTRPKVIPFDDGRAKEG